MPVLRFSLPSLAVLAALANPAMPAAQEAADETSSAQPSPAPAPPPGGINLSVTVPRNESDRAVEERCESEADAGKVAGEIVVCRRLGEASDGSWDSEKWKKEYAERTALKGAPRSPDFILDCKDQGMPFGCVGLGKAPPPALLIDVTALPKAPPGSDADRIARGLPPLGKDAEPTPEQIAERRRKLGLETKPPGQAPK